MNASADAHSEFSAETADSPHERTAIAILFFCFVITLPLLNPWVRGDGIGYYAFARSILIEHKLDFTEDYLHANPGFREAHVDASGEIRKEFYTRTGHLDNHFTVGPAILWSPFLVVAHGGVLAARAFGSSVSADGFSAPYRVAMAFGTAVYGFLGLLLSFRLALKYAGCRYALLATVGIWWASSLLFYMYFNPSWSHAHSAFTVAAFLSWWQSSRGERTALQWIVLGCLAGLMLNVYYANALVLTAPLVEAFQQYYRKLKSSPSDFRVALRLFQRHVLFCAVILLCLLPTFASRKVIYGSPLETGYVSLRDWLWKSPVLLQVLVSSDHGLFSWTPILFLAAAGLFLLAFRQPRNGGPLLASALAFYLFIACYPDWDGLASYGNRFFVSLTPFFVLGLAVTLEQFAKRFRRERAGAAAVSGMLGVLILWNCGLLFQWATHLIPVRGPIPWSVMVRNQFVTVPRMAGQGLRAYFLHRSALMKGIEQKDIEQMKSQPPNPR